jgi:hypothetical protein
VRATRLLNLMRSIGVTNTRLHISWAEVERQRGRYDWQRTDTLIHLLKERGLVVTCVVDGTPTWARDPDPAVARQLVGREGGDPGRALPPRPEFLPAFGRFVYALVSRNRNSVSRWEVWNEPDGAGLLQIVRTPSGVQVRASGDPAGYLRLLRAFTTNAKRANPACLIGIGGLGTPNLTFLQALYAAGARALFDAVCLHPADPAGTMYLSWIDACRALMLGRADDRKRIWVTAWGWNTYPADPDGLVEGEQADLIRVGLTAMWERPYIEMACVQTLNDGAATRPDLLLQDPAAVGTGLYTHDLQPRPAATAFAVAALKLRLSLPQTRTVGPTAAIPAPLASSRITVDIDAGDIVGRLPTLWRGVQMPTAAQYALAEAGWHDLGASYVAAGAPLLRLMPFRPGAITLTSDGTPIVSWESVDARLHAATQAGASVALALPAPAALSASAWRSFVTAATRRYGAGYGVVRWELAATAEAAATRYPLFARTVRAALPGIPVGIDLLDPDLLPAIRNLLAHLPPRVPFDALGFPIGTDPTRAAWTVRRLRALLARSPQARNTDLLPDLSLTTAEGAREEGRAITAAQAVALAARLADYAPADHANAAPGGLTTLPSPGTEAEQNTAATGALLLLNRVAGARLRVVEERSEVRCLATRMKNGISALIWRERAGERPGIDLVSVRLHNLPRSPLGGWRITRRNADLAAPAPTASGLPTPITLADLPAVVADAPAGSDLELPLILSSDTVTLITLQPHRTPTLELSLSASRPIAYGGTPQEVSVVVRNTTGRAQSVALKVSGSHTGMVSAERATLPVGLLPPGGQRRLRLSLQSPLTGRDTEAWVQVQLNTATAGESRAAITWQVLTPLQATVATPRVDLPASGERATVRLQLSNRSETPLPVTLHGAGAPISLTLPANDRPVTQEVEVAPPTANDAEGLNRVGIDIRSGDVPLRTLYALLGVPIPCPYLATVPALDGDMRPWQEGAAPPLGMGREEQWHSRSRPWEGPQDLSAIAYVAWDDRCLYFACVVTQTRFTPPPTVGAIMTHDAVRFALSAVPGRRQAGGGYGLGDHEFALALIGGKEATVVRLAGELGGIVTGARATILRNGTRTTYQAAIPWSELAPMTPHPGTSFGFAVAVGQGDGQTGGVMEWGGGLAGAKRPDLFTPLKLVR